MAEMIGFVAVVAGVALFVIGTLAAIGFIIATDEGEMSDAEIFCRIGEAMDAGNGKGAMARDLGVRQSSVQQGASGKNRLRPGIWLSVVEVIDRRIGELGQLRDRAVDASAVKENA